MSSQKYVFSHDLNMTGKLGFRQYGHLRQLFGLKDLMMQDMLQPSQNGHATIISHNGDGKKHSY